MILTQKSCHCCGKSAPLMLPYDGLRYYCPDSLDCVRERREYRKALKANTCKHDPQHLFDRHEEAVISSSFALIRATSRCSEWTPKDDAIYELYAAATLVTKTCVCCGTESPRQLRDDGRPYYCRQTAECKKARDRYQNSQRRAA